MTFSRIHAYGEINKVEPDKVEAIKNSILEKGFVGCPILYVEGLGLVTGSHRYAALKQIEEGCLDFDSQNFDIDTDIVCEDVSDIINKYCENEECSFDQIDFSSLGRVFEGTWVEQYKDDIDEW